MLHLSHRSLSGKQTPVCESTELCVQASDKHHWGTVLSLLLFTTYTADFKYCTESSAEIWVYGEWTQEQIQGPGQPGVGQIIHRWQQPKRWWSFFLGISSHPLQSALLGQKLKVYQSTWVFNWAVGHSGP